MSNSKKAVFAFILTSIIWGMGSPIFKWSLTTISPLTLAFFRFFIPVLVMLPFIGHLQRVRMKDIFPFTLLGLFDMTFNIGLYFIGLKYTLSINQPVIACSGPIFVLLGSALFLQDRAKRKVLFGNLIGLTGVLFIVVEPIIGAHNGGSVLGNLLFILATLSASIGTLVSKKLAKRYNAFTLLFWTFVVASISFLPILFEDLSSGTLWQQINVHSLPAILFGGIISSLFAYWLFYWGLHYIKASETAVFSYIDPVAALLIAAPLLHEYPNPIFIFGSVLVFFGIYIAEGRLHWHPIHKLFT